MKKIFLLSLILILSGCSVEYNLDIDKDINLIENIKINASTAEEIAEIEDYNGYQPINGDYDDPLVYEEKQEDIEYYNIEKENNSIKFNYTFDQETYLNSTFTNTAYEFISVTEVGDELVLSTSKEFLLFNYYDNLDEVKVTINSKYKLITSNADEEKRHSYTWIINKENAYGKNIYLKLDTSVEDLTFLERLKNGEYTNIFTISILIALIGIIIYLLIKRKGDTRNKI